MKLDIGGLVFGLEGGAEELDLIARGPKKNGYRTNLRMTYRPDEHAPPLDRIVHTYESQLAKALLTDVQRISLSPAHIPGADSALELTANIEVEGHAVHHRVLFIRARGQLMTVAMSARAGDDSMLTAREVRILE